MPPSMSLPEALTAEELRDRPTDAGVPDDDDEEGDPWDALDVNEYEGPSVGKAKASHAAPPDSSAKAPPAEPESPTAASTGEPTRENELSGTVCPKHARGHVEKYRIMLDENINSEVVEHCVVDGHSFELNPQFLQLIVPPHNVALDPVHDGIPIALWIPLPPNWKGFNSILPANLVTRPKDHRNDANCRTVIGKLRRQIPSHSKICFAELLKILAPEHIMTDFKNHVSLSQGKVLLQGVLFQSLTLSSDQRQRRI